MRGVQYIKERVDTSKVHPKDLSYVEDILYGILEFEQPMPELNMVVKNNPGEYVIIVEGYNKPFLVSEWYTYFDNKDTRSAKFRHIQNTRINPKTGNVEIVVMRVSDDRRPAPVHAKATPMRHHAVAQMRPTASATPRRGVGGVARRAPPPPTPMPMRDEYDYDDQEDYGQEI